MRLRFKPWAHAKLSEIDLVWNREQFLVHDFKKYLSLELEIGIGKGDFIIAKAIANPQIHYLGIEKYESVLVIAAQKAADLEISNITLVSLDASELLINTSLNHHINNIYLNFSDPWPKKRHQKRRLTHLNYLAIYQNLTTSSGNLIIKTDNDSLFEFTIQQIRTKGIKIEKIDYNYHSSPSLMTEYETKFRNKGIPIKHLIANINKQG